MRTHREPSANAGYIIPLTKTVSAGAQPQSLSAANMARVATSRGFAGRTPRDWPGWMYRGRSPAGVAVKQATDTIDASSANDRLVGSRPARSVAPVRLGSFPCSAPSLLRHLCRAWIRQSGRVGLIDTTVASTAAQVSPSIR